MSNSAFRQQILMPLEVVAVATTGTINKNFVTDAAGTTAVTLPASGQPGDGFGVGTIQGDFQITVGPGQTVLFANGVSSVAGTITSSAVGDWVSIVCVVSNVTWIVTSTQGLVTVA